MTSLTVADQLAELRSVVFGAIDQWNAEHPHRLGSRRERAAVNVTQVFADATGAASFSIAVVCTLAGSAPLSFHGHDLATVAEHARLTLERKIAVELKDRTDKVREVEFDRKYGYAV